MQKTGTITNIQPTEQGGYSGQSGWIHTFDMTIQTTDAGLMTGEIGSTSTPYPIAIGQEITVTVTNGQYGPKFKRFNPRQGGGQPQGGQGQRSAPPAPQNAGRDYDKENKGKCFCNYVSSRLAAGVCAIDILADTAETDAMWTLAKMSIDGPVQGGLNQSQQNQHDNAARTGGPDDQEMPWDG